MQHGLKKVKNAKPTKCQLDKFKVSQLYSSLRFAFLNIFSQIFVPLDHLDLKQIRTGLHAMLMRGFPTFVLWLRLVFAPAEITNQI